MRRDLRILFLGLLLLVLGGIAVAAMATSGNQVQQGRAADVAPTRVPVSDTLQLLSAMQPLYHVSNSAALRDVGYSGPGQTVHLAWSPDGKLVAVARLDTVELYEGATGRPVFSLTIPYPQGDAFRFLESMAWSPNGSLLAIGTYGNTILLVDPAARRIAVKIEGPMPRQGADRPPYPAWSSLVNSIVQSLAWSPDGRALASAAFDPLSVDEISWDGVIRLWDPASGKEIRSIPVRSQGSRDLAWAWQVAWSPDGSMISATTQDGTVRLFDAANGSELRAMQGESVSWSPVERRLALLLDRVVQLWDPASDGPVFALPRGELPPLPPPIPTRSPLLPTPTLPPADLAPYGHVLATEWAPDGRTLATADGATVRLWDTATGELRQALSLRAYSLAWSPDARVLAVAGDGIAFLDPATGRVLRSLPPGESTVGSLVWSPNGDYLGIAGTNSVTVWGAPAGVQATEGPAQAGAGQEATRLFSLAFSKPGTLLTVEGFGVAADGSFWIVGEDKRLQHYSSTGRPLGEVDISYRLYMVYDLEAYDNAVWVYDGNLVLKFSADGQPLHGYNPFAAQSGLQAHQPDLTQVLQPDEGSGVGNSRQMLLGDGNRYFVVADQKLDADGKLDPQPLPGYEAYGRIYWQLEGTDDVIMAGDVAVKVEIPETITRMHVFKVLPDQSFYVVVQALGPPDVPGGWGTTPQYVMHYDAKGTLIERARLPGGGRGPVNIKQLAATDDGTFYLAWQQFDRNRVPPDQVDILRLSFYPASSPLPPVPTPTITPIPPTPLPTRPPPLPVSTP